MQSTNHSAHIICFTGEKHRINDRRDTIFLHSLKKFPHFLVPRTFRSLLSSWIKIACTRHPCNNNIPRCLVYNKTPYMDPGMAKTPKKWPFLTKKNCLQLAVLGISIGPKIYFGTFSSTSTYRLSESIIRSLYVISGKYNAQNSRIYVKTLKFGLNLTVFAIFIWLFCYVVCVKMTIFRHIQ